MPGLAARAVEEIPRRAARRQPRCPSGAAVVGAGGRREPPALAHGPDGRHGRPRQGAQPRRGVAAVLRGLHPGPGSGWCARPPTGTGARRAAGPVGLLRLRRRPDRPGHRALPPGAGRRRPRGGGQGAVTGRRRPPLPCCDGSSGRPPADPRRSAPRDRALEIEPAAAPPRRGPARPRRRCRSPAWSPTPGAPSSSTGPSSGPSPAARRRRPGWAPRSTAGSSSGPTASSSCWSPRPTPTSIPTCCPAVPGWPPG